MSFCRYYWPYAHACITYSMQINENGVISFDKPWKYSYPNRFPTSFYWTRQGLAVAPFWSDNDIRKEGAVLYAAYNIIERATKPEGQALMDDVNEYIQNLQEEGEQRFRGKWLLVVHWDHVHPSPHGEEDHEGIPEDELEKVYIACQFGCCRTTGDQCKRCTCMCIALEYM